MVKDVIDTVVDAVVIGGGIAGLTCANYLHKAGISFRLFESSGSTGGRIQTDVVEGFRLDHGFQVLLEAYPEARALLDYSKLDLKPFTPGAYIQENERRYMIVDPVRKPFFALKSMADSIGTVSDKLGILALRGQLRKMPVAEIFERPETTTLQRLKDSGFSQDFIERFFRPFYTGIYLEDGLQNSSRSFEFIFKMFSEGNTSIPAQGMGMLVKQLTASLPENSIAVNTKVTSASNRSVQIASGERILADAVVCAADASGATALAGTPEPRYATAATFYFDAPEPPLEHPMLLLNGLGDGIINNMCIPSSVSPDYAPVGRSLISVSIVTNPTEADEVLVQKVRRQLTIWFGEAVSNWRYIRSYRIWKALPTFDSVPCPDRVEPDMKGGIFLCGDHRHDPSINGAMYSGRKAAEAVIAKLSAS